jgi:dTDP-4-dehydrorhamnose 3,5-epimerase-like enzyme
MENYKRNIFEDKRGTLIFPIKNSNYSFKECTVSINKKNVFRGIHINDFEKLITCIQGKIIDIVINIETSEVKYYTLLPGDQLLIPKNYGHSFLTIEENSILLYHFEKPFTNTRFIHYSTYDIKLPPNVIISDKDNCN